MISFCLFIIFIILLFVYFVYFFLYFFILQSHYFKFGIFFCSVGLMCSSHERKLVAEEEFLLLQSPHSAKDSVFKLSLCFSISSVVVHRSYLERHRATLGFSGIGTK